MSSQDTVSPNDSQGTSNEPPAPLQSRSRDGGNTSLSNPNNFATEAGGERTVNEVTNMTNRSGNSAPPLLSATRVVGSVRNQHNFLPRSLSGTEQGSTGLYSSHERSSSSGTAQIKIPETTFEIIDSVFDVLDDDDERRRRPTL